MGNRSDHYPAGACFGGLVAALSALVANRAPTWAEVLGGAAAGLVTSALPDVLEPATHPGHRGVAHSVAALGTGVGLGLPAAHRFQDRVARASGDETDPVKRFMAQFCAGAAAGAVAGYGSHLLLDATTPRSLPLIA
jgi:inner membrane protein